jgi:beta-glucanase (GH16 family)
MKFSCLLIANLFFFYSIEVNALYWNLVWSDEFEYDGFPDEKKWAYEDGFVRNKYNKELQYYTMRRKKNVRVEDGKLIIEAHKEKFDNLNYNPTSRRWQQQQKFSNYTSGSLKTQSKFSFKYGRLSVRAKLPRGSGMWPAIWMMGVNRVDVGWPACGEIDIMEYSGANGNNIHASNHYADPSIKDKFVHFSSESGKGDITIPEPFSDFHIYSIEWNENFIKFFVDDLQYANFIIDEAGLGENNPFRQYHYLIINLALGGWGGAIDDGYLPQKYEIDYVRIYSLQE